MPEPGNPPPEVACVGFQVLQLFSEFLSETFLSLVPDPPTQSPLSNLAASVLCALGHHPIQQQCSLQFYRFKFSKREIRSQVSNCNHVPYVGNKQYRGHRKQGK